MSWWARCPGITRLSSRRRELDALTQRVAGLFAGQAGAALVPRLQQEQGLRWDDPVVGIQWPVKTPYLSDKDRHLPFLSEITWTVDTQVSVPNAKPSKRSRRKGRSVSL